MRHFKTISVDYTLKHIYNSYKKNFPKKIQVNKQDFIKINAEFAKLLKNKILLDSEEVGLPCGGSLRIKKVLQRFSKDTTGKINKNRLKIDWAATKKAGKQIFHTNEHRAGYYYMVSWIRPAKPYVRFYNFLPTRYTFKRKLSILLKTKPELDYYL